MLLSNRWASHTSRQLQTISDQLATLIDTIGAFMSQQSDDQAHLELDVAGIIAAIGTALQELKDQIAANPGQPASALDFTSADALLASTQAEAVADAPIPPAGP